MKKYSQLLLLAIAFIMLLVGISIPGRESPKHIIFVIAAVLLGFIFYLRIFWEVIKTPELGSDERIFWIVAIVCLPVIGNMLYVIIHYSAAGKQVLKPEI
jgi:hypothetical protein